ncbi:hypothetical protein [Psychroflexus sediminis]|uniref:Uncharacterized protein n=1 Tax=Psychroflexus sediminis TaxID=470826 RepID=A0A1G7WTC9_9FLAO|nr:hypothetical protein [Psychroflexus sediminis]SDG75154.1 hypothetical protein SAMN04488027_106115 [Psychroflexus sediminis]
MKDLRKDFKYTENQLKMPEGHLERFQMKLGPEPDKSAGQSLWIQRIAAVLILGILISTYWFPNASPISNTSTIADETVDLNDISPELGNLETFFKTSINYELATLEYGNYEDVAFSYLDELEKIEKDYKKLSKDLQTHGYNKLIIDAMIENLQLRLELLQNLKLKLNELKTLNHEKDQTYQL